jgi:uncharacterized membrane protein YccC
VTESGGTQKDLLGRLADAGEDALQRFADAPGMERLMTVANTTRQRLDELTKRVQGISDLERRIERLEQQVAELSGGGTAAVADEVPPVAEPVPATEDVLPTPTHVSPTADEALSAPDEILPAEQPPTGGPADSDGSA